MLFWWNLRDAMWCQFGVTVLLVAAPLLYLAVRNTWLIRGSLALLIYILAITLASPQVVDAVVPGSSSHARATTLADVRYLVPTIPLCIALGIMVLLTLRKWIKAAACCWRSWPSAQTPWDYSGSSRAAYVYAARH